MKAPTFVDGFLLWVAGLVAVAMFVDFLLGPAKRAQIRDAVGEWGCHLQTTSFPDIISEASGKIRHFIIRGFGDWLSWRNFFLSCSSSLLLVGIAVVIFWFVIKRGQVELGVYRFLAYAFQNALLDWLSLGVTLGLLQLMKQQTRTAPLLALISLDLFLALILAFFVVYGALIIDRYTPVLLTMPLIKIRGFDTLIIFDQMNIRQLAYLASDRLIDLVALIFTGRAFYSLTFIVVFTSALPTLIHLIITILLVVLKMSWPVLRPIISLLLRRFSQSDKGVFTLVAGGAGVLAKVIQEGVKYFTST